jgi:hypothetical protein
MAKQNPRYRYWSDADWLEPFVSYNNLEVIAIGTGELLALGDIPEDDEEFYDNSWIKAETTTVTRWTSKLPQIRWVFMEYGYDNYEDIKLEMFDMGTHKSLWERKDRGVWERHTSDRKYAECFPDKHPRPIFY